MKKTITILLVVCLVSGFAFAGLEDSSGFSQKINFGRDFRASLNAQNNDAYIETWNDSWTGEEHSYWHEKRAWGSVSLDISQMVVPHRPSIEVYRWNDEGRLNIQIELPFIYTDSFEKFPQIPFGGIMWDLGGLNFNTYLSIHTLREGTLEGELVGQRIWANGSFNFRDAEVTYADMLLRNYTHDKTYDGFVLRGYFDIQLIGDKNQIEMANAMFAVIPEPATFGILGLGAVAIFRRKK